MGWIFLLLLNPAAGESSELRLSGYVPPTMSAVVNPENDGLSLRNSGNEVTLFQVGSRSSPFRQSALVGQGQSLSLHTDFVQHGDNPMEICILAP